MIRRRKFQINPNHAIAGRRIEAQNCPAASEVVQNDSNPAKLTTSEPTTFTLPDMKSPQRMDTDVKIDSREKSPEAIVVSPTLANVSTCVLSPPKTSLTTPPETSAFDNTMSAILNNLDEDDDIDVVTTTQSSITKTLSNACDSDCRTSSEDSETISQDSNHIEVVDTDEPISSSSSTKFSQNCRGRKRAAKSGEELDTKKFTLADLIDWRPKTENTLRKKWDEKRQQMLEIMTTTSGLGDEDEPSSSSSLKFNNKEPAAAAPRVKINEKGEMVIDEESLVVLENPESNVWETVDDSCMPKKLNSMSFRKNRRPTAWCALETDLFYEVLAATGTDFTLMHEFLPTRTRAEIKKKFNREEKMDPERLNLSLRYPTLLDNTLYERVSIFRKKIDEAANEKLNKVNEKKQQMDVRRAEREAKRELKKLEVLKNMKNV